MPASYYVVFIKALSPVYIKKRRSPRGYESVEHIIPGSSLGGALARALGFNGYAHISRGYSVSDAYPLVRKEGKCLLSMPPTPFTYKLKAGSDRVKARVLVCTPSPNAREVVFEQLEGMLGYTPVGLIKRVKEEPIAPHVDEGARVIESGSVRCYAAEAVSVEASVTYDSVAINVSRGSAEPQMLFTYYAIPAGAEFWATAAIPDDVAKKIGDSVSIVAWLGGGKSRGYGKVLIKMARIEDNVLKRMAEASECPLYMLWSRMPLPPSAPTSGRPMFRWSTVLASPALSIPSLAPGAILNVEVCEKMAQGWGLPGCSRRSVVELRFEGLIPPLGHIEPLCNAFPVSVKVFSSIVCQLASKSVQEVGE